MSKSMLVGVVAGVGLATAGGVLGYQFLGQQGAEVEAEQAASVAADPVARAPSQAARTAAAPAPAEECWDEEVQVTADPKDQH
ncbi:MAG: hypothetical protein EHM50_11265, partial [Lysobacterales bacterium]